MRLFLDGKMIDPADYDKIAIHCVGIDRIVNDVVDNRVIVVPDEDEEEEQEQGPTMGGMAAL